MRAFLIISSTYYYTTLPNIHLYSSWFKRKVQTNIFGSQGSTSLANVMKNELNYTQRKNRHKPADLQQQRVLIDTATAT